MSENTVKIALSLTEQECLTVIKALNSADIFGRVRARDVYLKICEEYESFKNALKERPQAAEGEEK
jgi:hypothetical protein